MQTIAGFWRRKLDLRLSALQVVSVNPHEGTGCRGFILALLHAEEHRNLNNEIGLPLSLLRLTAGYQCAVLEMGFYVLGEIAFLCDLALRR